MNIAVVMVYVLTAYVEDEANDSFMLTFTTQLAIFLQVICRLLHNDGTQGNDGSANMASFL